MWEVRIASGEGLNADGEEGARSRTEAANMGNGSVGDKH